MSNQHRRNLNGCYTCRIRGKKCDVDTLFELNTGRVPCRTCQRLQIECTGYGERYPAWMRDRGRLRRIIKQRLMTTWHIRSYNLPRSSTNHIVVIDGILRLSPLHVSTPSFPAPSSMPMQLDPMEGPLVSNPEQTSAHQLMDEGIGSGLRVSTSILSDSGRLAVNMNDVSDLEQHPTEGFVLTDYNPGLPYEYRRQLEDFSDDHLFSRDRSPVSIGEALGALQLVCDSLLAADARPWKKYLRIAFNYVHPIICSIAICNFDPSTLFIVQITGWFCVLAAISNDFNSESLKIFRDLFDVENYVDDHAHRYMDMRAIMCVDCRVLWALADTTDLAQAKPTGTITKDEICRRGEMIERRLQESWIPYSQSEGIADPEGIYVRRWCTGELFRLSALLYYFAVIRNHNPYDEDVSRCVDDIINLTLLIDPSSITSRMCILSIFLCGALHRNEGQRIYLERSLNDACAEGVGNSRAVLDVLKEIWQERERNPSGDRHVNWREPLEKKHLLLVSCDTYTGIGHISDSIPFFYHVPTPLSHDATSNTASTQDDLSEDALVAGPELPSSESQLSTDDGSGTPISARSNLHEGVGHMDDCEAIPQSEQHDVEDLTTIDNELGPSSSQSSWNPYIQQQYHTVTEWLTYWKISGVVDLTDKIEISNQEEPSRGGFSEVFKGFYNTDSHENNLVAIKKLSINFKSTLSAEGALRLYKRLIREVRVWADLSHPNIVRLLGVYMRQPDTRPGMVMPWYKNTSASSYLTTRKFSILEKLTLFHDIACGLAYLHTRNPPVVHGDLKALNVLINNGGRAMLCDFGVSRIIEEALESTGTTTANMAEGTLQWSAPEVVSGEEPTRFTPASDVWSFGCTGYEIFTGKIPYYDIIKRHRIGVLIEKGVTPTWPPNVFHNYTTQQGNGTECIPDFLINFINSRWKHDPVQRGRMSKIKDEMQSMIHEYGDGACSGDQLRKKRVFLGEAHRGGDEIPELSSLSVAGSDTYHYNRPHRIPLQ